MTVSRIDHVGITTSDVDRSLAFYRDLLGMRIIDDLVVTSPEIASLLGVDSVELRIVDLDSGDGRIVELIKYMQPEGKPATYDSRDAGTGHIAFTVDDLDRVRRRIAAAGGRVISHQPITITDPRGLFDGATCLYLRDPDGMILELVQRP